MNKQLEFGREKDEGQVECLGLLFPNDDARRAHFLKELAEKLKEPAFRNQDGFPLGSDDAILSMSDPPYYTACPNPWLKCFVVHNGKSFDPDQKYSRESLATDVSVGKTHPIYKAHSYHTKVPHLAIVPYILHYTEPGEIVLDGFSGSGMTGVAATWCGRAPESYRFQIEDERKNSKLPAPKWGERKAVLNDLSPSATFIGANYNLPIQLDSFAIAGKELLEYVDEKLGWLYETLHIDGKTVGRIEYTVWSECFGCQSCGGEVVFSEAASSEESKKVSKIIVCSHCGVESVKEKMDLIFENYLDPVSGQIAKRPKRVPVKIVYTVGSDKYSKIPDANDIERIKQAADLPIPNELPLISLGDSQMTRVGRMKTTKTTCVHHLFLPRAAQSISLMWRIANDNNCQRIRNALLFLVEQALWTMSLCNSYRPAGYSQVGQYMKGIYYIPSQHAELSPWYVLNGKLNRLTKSLNYLETNLQNTIISTGKASDLQIPDNSIDYIFTDPPFGENIYYAELNIFVEAWHGVTTDSNPETIIDRIKNKSLPIYQSMMLKCFLEYYRALKPGRWMTVIFSNSRAAVWNSIQVGLQQAGFVVAEVTALDRKQGTFQQVVSPNTVKQDLVISAYKPNGGLEERLAKRGPVPESAWDFVETHLGQLAVTKQKDGILEMVAERDPRRIYDRMVAWFVRHHFPVPLSIEDFLGGLRTRYTERDGMVFLDGQLAEYERERMRTTQSPQMEIFVSDERSAIDWLMDFLRNRPSTYQDIHPEFMSQLGAGWRKHEEKPELITLLEDNFLRYDGNTDIPSQIHGYLSSNFKNLRGLEKNNARLMVKAKDRWYLPDPNKAQDLEQKRMRSLLKEFSLYKSSPRQRLKEFRLEVLRAGFREAWATNDYKTIIGIASILPEETLHEDEQLLLWYDQSLTRTEGDA